MLLNSHQVQEHLQTKGLGERAQVGYDLTIKAVKRVHGGMVLKDKTVVEDYEELSPNLSPTGRYIYNLTPGVYSLTFDQGIKLDKKHTAFIRHRSSILRCGAQITSGVYDPGFEVEEMGAVMFVNSTIHIEKGARTAQVIIFENYEADAYSGQFLGAKDIK